MIMYPLLRPRTWVLRLMPLQVRLLDNAVNPPKKRERRCLMKRLTPEQIEVAVERLKKVRGEIDEVLSEVLRGF
jgi:hypothetical protein